jgi:hypothetical protein
VGGALDARAPLWGIVERASASAVHIGFTLILARQPALAPATALATAPPTSPSFT